MNTHERSETVNSQVRATMNPGDRNRYSAVSIVLHWFTLFLIAAVYTCIELREQFPKGSDVREALKMWHYMLGLSAFVITWVRVAFRTFGANIRSESNRSVDATLAKIVHVALYFLLLVMPLLGWLILSAEGKPIPFFGLELPPLIGPDERLLVVLEETHEAIGTLGYALIAGHALAALHHHFVRHDDTLVRMLPRNQ